MNCQNCEYPILPSDEKCPHCGALPLRQRVTFGARREEFALTREDEPFELGELAQADDWQSSVEQKSEPERPVTKPAGPSIPEIHWGGFFRRACAFVIDGHRYFGAFNDNVLYVLYRLQSRVVGAWTRTDLGAFNAIFCVVYVGVDRFGDSVFCDFSWSRRKDHREVAVGTPGGGGRTKRRDVSAGFFALARIGWLRSRVVRLPVDSVEP